MLPSAFSDNVILKNLRKTPTTFRNFIGKSRHRSRMPAYRSAGTDIGGDVMPAKKKKQKTRCGGLHNSMWMTECGLVAHIGI